MLLYIDGSKAEGAKPHFSNFTPDPKNVIVRHRKWKTCGILRLFVWIISLNRGKMLQGSVFCKLYIILGNNWRKMRLGTFCTGHWKTNVCMWIGKRCQAKDSTMQMVTSARHQRSFLAKMKEKA